MPAAKPITGQLDISAWRNDDWFEFPLRVIGLDVSELALAMDIREAGDVGGPPLVHLAKVTIEQTETQGLRVAGVSVVEGVPISELRIRMDRGTLQGLPYYGAFGDAAAFNYAVLIGGRTRLEGKFILPAHAYGSDAAPDDRQMATGYAGSSALPVGGATLEVSNDGGAAVVIDGADVLGGLREASEAARDVSVAAAAQAVIALDNLSRDAVEFIGRPADATLVNGTAVSTGAIYWRDAIDHAGTFASLDLFDKVAGTVRVAVYRGAPAALTRVALTSVATNGSGSVRTLALGAPIAVLPGDIIALQAQVAGAFSVNEVQSGDAGYTYSFPDLPETIALDAPTTNGQLQVRFRISYREQIVTAESFAALSTVKILSPRAVALSSALDPRGYVAWTTTGQPTAHTVSWGGYTAKLDGQAQRFDFPNYSLAQPFAFAGNSLTDSTDVTNRWSQVLAARYGQPLISVARYSSDGRQVYRTGAKAILLTLAGALPAAGSVAVSQINGAAIDGNNPAAFLTTGDAGLTTGMSLSGYVERNGVTRRVTVSAPNGGSFAYSVTQAPGQTAITFDGPVTFVPDFALSVRGRTCVVWIGNNFFFSGVANEYGDHTNPGMWVDLKLIVAFLQARGCRVLLLPVIPAADWTTTGLGTPMTASRAANARTEALFPDLYARDASGRDLIQFLQSRHDGSANDLADIANGFTPRSLRRKPDGSYDLLHMYGAGSGDLAVADFVDSALQVQTLPDAITQTTEFAIAAFGADWQEADTALVRVSRDPVVADLADALDGALTDLAYRPTLAAAIADFDVGTFFTSRDTAGVSEFPGVKRQYQIISAAPYWADRGPWADPTDFGLDEVDNTRDASKPVSEPQQIALDDKPLTVGHVAALRARDASGLATGRSAVLMGYHSAIMPLGGGLFTWDADSTEADDGGLVFKPDGVAGAGRWRRVGAKSVDITDFGAVPGQLSHDAIQRAVDKSSALGGGEVYTPYADTPFLLGQTVFARQATTFVGGGFDRRTLGNTPKGSCFRRAVGGFPMIVFDGSATGINERIRFCGLRDMHIDGNNLAGNVLELKTVQNFRMERSYLTGTPNKLLWARDYFDCAFSHNYYVRGGTDGGDPATHIDDSLGTGSAHNNNIRHFGDTWERNFGTPLLIDGKGSGPGNSTINMYACKMENTERNSYLLDIDSASACAFYDHLLVGAGTAGNVIPAQILMTSVKGIKGRFICSHQYGAGTAGLKSIADVIGYSQVDLEIINSGGNAVGGLSSGFVFNNSAGDDKSLFRCVDIGSKAIALNNPLTLVQQPTKFDGPGTTLARFMRAGGSAANTVIEFMGALVDGVRLSMFPGIDANGNFGINTTADLLTAPFKVFRSGKVGVKGTSDAPLQINNLRTWGDGNVLMANNGTDPESGTDGFALTPRTVSKMIDLPSIAPGGSYSTTIAVPGVLPGQRVVACFSGGGFGLMIYAECNAADTVRVIAFNPTTAAIDLPSRTLNLSILAAPATPLT